MRRFRSIAVETKRFGGDRMPGTLAWHACLLFGQGPGCTKRLGAQRDVLSAGVEFRNPEQRRLPLFSGRRKR